MRIIRLVGQAPPAVLAVVHDQVVVETAAEAPV
jgi:hypothetical protein